MSVSIVFSGAPDGDDGPFDLGLTAGWCDFCRWAELLPATYPAVLKLAVIGAVTGTHNLSEQLNDAIATVPPVGGALAAAGLLLDVMGVGDSDETATVIA